MVHNSHVEVGLSWCCDSCNGVDCQCSVKAARMSPITSVSGIKHQAYSAAHEQTEKCEM